MYVKITFDPTKDAANIAKHGVSMALASELDWESAQLWQDTRMEYGEIRIIALALIKTTRILCGIHRPRRLSPHY